MKVLLINPPRDNEIIGNNPPFIEKERGNNPPLGLLYIAAYLDASKHHQVKVLDAQVEKLNYPMLERRIIKEEPDVVGITVMTMTLIDVIKTANMVKKINPKIKVICGGPHVYLYPKETISFSCVDFLVLGEGEKVFLELLNHIESLDHLAKVPGLVFKKNNEIITTGKPIIIENLDELPFPARYLTPYEKYNSLLSNGRVVTTIFTSRGCPFQCSFCDRPHLGKIFRKRTTDNVIREIQECINMGIMDFLFYDDTFTVDKERAKEICKEIIERKLNIRWDIRSRIDTIDEELILLLKRAGCQGIHYGIEAGTEKILKILKKGVSLDQVKKVVDMTRKNHIPVLTYFMIGNPGETKSDIYASFKLMKALRPDYVHITILSPFPGTQVYFDGLKNKRISKDYWREFSENPSSDFIPPHWDENFTRKELEKLLMKGYFCFYFQPVYLFKQLIHLKNAKELMKKARAGLSLFRFSIKRKYF